MAHEITNNVILGMQIQTMSYINVFMGYEICFSVLKVSTFIHFANKVKISLQKSKL